MSTLHVLRSRLKTIKTIVKATNAVKVTTNIKLARIKSKLRSVEHNLEFAEKFWRSMNYYFACTSKDIIAHSSTDAIPNQSNMLDFPLEDQVLFIKNHVRPTAINHIIIFSDRGLCGGYNAQLHKYCINKLGQYSSTIPKKIIIVGSKGFKYANQYTKLLNLNPGDVSLIEKSKFSISNLQDNGYVFNVHYNKYISILEQVPTTNSIDLSAICGNNKSGATEAQDSENISEEHLCGTSRFMLVEYGQTSQTDLWALTKTIFTNYLQSKLYYILSTAELAEQCARLVIMDSSLKNAEGLKDELQSKINKTRQDNITNQMIELVASSSL